MVQNILKGVVVVFVLVRCLDAVPDSEGVTVPEVLQRIDDDVVIFSHLPKSAGTSFRKDFERIMWNVTKVCRSHERDHFWSGFVRDTLLGKKPCRAISAEVNVPSILSVNRNHSKISVVLREPLLHSVSALNWIEEYSSNLVDVTHAIDTLNLDCVPKFTEWLAGKVMGQYTGTLKLQKNVSAHVKTPKQAAPFFTGAMYRWPWQHWNSQTAGSLQDSLHSLFNLWHVGIVEHYHESMCLLSYQAGAFESERCLCGSHSAPSTDDTHANTRATKLVHFDEATQARMQAARREDQLIYGCAQFLFQARLAAAERALGRRFGCHPLPAPTALQPRSSRPLTLEWCREEAAKGSSVSAQTAGGASAERDRSEGGKGGGWARKGKKRKRTNGKRGPSKGGEARAKEHGGEGQSSAKGRKDGGTERPAAGASRSREQEEEGEEEEEEARAGRRGRVWAHVTALPPARMMTPHRILESTVAIWSMVQAQRHAEAQGAATVRLLLLVEPPDLQAQSRHPVLQQIEPWLHRLRIEPIPRKYVADVVPDDYDRDRAAALPNRTVTLLRDVLSIAARVFPEAEAFVSSNPDIALFLDTYSWMMAQPAGEAMSVARVEVSCAPGSEHPQPCSEIVRLTEREGVQRLKETEMMLLERDARRWPQKHPGHDTFVIPAALMPCLLRGMPAVFYGFAPIGHATLDFLRACACADSSTHVRVVRGGKHTLHLGIGDVTRLAAREAQDPLNHLNDALRQRHRFSNYHDNHCADRRPPAGGADEGAEEEGLKAAAGETAMREIHNGAGDR